MYIVYCHSILNIKQNVQYRMNCISIYVIVWLAVVFGISSTSNAGKKIVIVQGTAKHYYNFYTCIASTINSKYYSKPYCYRFIYLFIYLLINNHPAGL